AVLAMGRAMLASGQLGQHNGLPVSVIISTTVRELESVAGIATTASGTRLSIPQVVAMAARARQYLAVFANHKEVPLYLGRAKRLASVGQRIALHARDRGCTKPGCPHPPDRCQGHHAEQDYAQGGQTDITDLTLACPKDNRLVSEHGWTTRVRDDGRIEWVPPPLLDTGQDRLNHYWRPEDLFHPNHHAPDNPCDEDAGADADSEDADGTAAHDAEPAEPGLPDDEPRHPSADETSDIGPASNGDEAPDDEAIQTIGGDDADADSAVTGDEAPAEPDPWPEVVTSEPEELRPTNVQDTGDADPAANDYEAPQHPAQPDQEVTRSIGGLDADDAVTGDEAPADPGLEPVETAPAPQDPHTSSRQAPDSHPHPAHSPNNRDGPDDP
ncbi:DUF222 domain-containing protein, partial [Mycobacterium sp. 852013-50091_SCH5140682]|uniref:DUF222 domain-containing protein n=1 Tax=Mycobacterium sp. 852013-50091_SCH5140682 TaxID=1834109 RepID=UPI000AF15209